MKPEKRVEKQSLNEELRTINEKLVFTNQKLEKNNAELQERLKESEEKYRSLFDSSDEGFCIVEVIFESNGEPSDLVILEYNQAFERQMGLSKMEGKSLQLCVPTKENDFIKLFGNVASTGESIRFDSYFSTNECWYSISASHIGKTPNRIIAVRFNNITKRKQTEEELRDSKNQLSLALDSAQTGIHVWNIAENTLEWDERLKEIWNLSSTDEVTFNLFSESLHPEDSEIVQTAINKALNSKGPGKYYSEFRIIRKNDQKIRWISATGQVFFTDEMPVRLIGTARDITKRKENENALHSKDELLSQITDVTPIMLARCSKELKYLFVNNTTAEFLGYPKEFIIEQPIRSILGEKAFATILPYIKKVLAGERVEFETEVHYSTAGKRYMHVVYVPESDSSNNIIGWFATITDITERKKAEQNNSFLASIIEFSNDAIISKNLDGIITSWNKSAERMFGYTSEEVIGQPITKLIPLSLSNEETEILKRLRNGESIKHYETIRQRKDGSLFEVSLTISPVKDKAGNIIGASKIVRDISERKLSEKKLLEQQHFTQNIIEAAPSLIYIYDILNECNLFISPQSVEILGYTADEIKEIGSEIFKRLIHPEDTAKFVERLSRILIGDEDEVFTLEYRLQHKDGRWIWLWSRDRIFRRNEKGMVTQILGVATDITSHKEAEEKLRRSEEFHSIISTISTDWAFSAQIKPDGQIIPDAITKGLTRHLGYTLDTLPASGGWKVLIHPEDLPSVLKQLKKLLLGETVRGNIRNVSKFGHTVISEYQVRPITDEKGQVFRVYGAIRDITQQKISEQFIQESEERLRSVIESATEYAIFSLTLDGKINSWSSGAKKIFGYSDNEIIGKSAEILFTTEDRQKNILHTKMQVALKQGRAFDDRFLLRKDSSQFFTSGVMMPMIKNGKTEGFVKIARDMTTQLLAEKAIRDLEILQKLVNAQEEERRRIARNLHDELGQQLTALRLKLENTRSICKDSLIRQEIDNVQEIVKQIDDGVDFFAWELRPAALDDLGLYPAIEKYIKEWSHYSGIRAELLPSTIKEVRLSLKIETNLYRIVQEALNNISKHSQAKKAEIMLEKRKNKIVLIIADNGKGFNPKAAHTGNTKIGLLGMQERAALLGGDLEIESISGKGTTVYVRVPVIFAKEENLNEK